jgi:hypothetical protein
MDEQLGRLQSRQKSSFGNFQTATGQCTECEEEETLLGHLGEIEGPAADTAEMEADTSADLAEIPSEDTEATAGGQGTGGATPAASCSINHQTGVYAADGTGKSRTTVGVFESIHFNVGGAVADWTPSAGWPGRRAGQASYNWAAPGRPGTYSITASVPATGASCSKLITVVAPNRVRMTRDSLWGTYASGTAGAGMNAVVWLYPRNVNFGWVSIKEDAGPASNLSGYFLAMSRRGANLYHNPNPNYVRMGWNNKYCCDTAATRPGVLPRPWSAGTWDWVIPMRYRYFNASSGGRLFTRTRQKFRINSSGRVTVLKQGASVSRSP